MGALPLFIAAALGIVAFSGGKAAGEAIAAYVKGGSGTTWETRVVKTVGDYSYIDVFYEGSRVLRYKQRGADKSTRALVDSPPGVSATLLAKAKKDFGIA